jgi:hypothetical protein
MVRSGSKKCAVGAKKRDQGAIVRLGPLIFGGWAIYFDSGLSLWVSDGRDTSVILGRWVAYLGATTERKERAESDDANDDDGRDGSTITSINPNNRGSGWSVKTRWTKYTVPAGLVNAGGAQSSNGLRAEWKTWKKLQQQKKGTQGKQSNDWITTAGWLLFLFLFCFCFCSCCIILRQPWGRRYVRS